MAMDKTTTRRMIGAIVLVLVAALVLAYLLKSKDSQPDVVQIQDVTLPSSPILAFPGEGGGNDVIVDQEANVDRAGLDIIPTGLKDSGGDNSQKQQTASKGNSSSTEKTKADDTEKKNDNLKKADVVSLGNSSKVSSKAAARDKVSDNNDDTSIDDSANKAEKKKEERRKQRAKIVNEKELPKYRDRSRSASRDTTADKEIELTEATDATSDAADESLTTGYSIQLLATSSESKANTFKKQMIAEGYPAYVAAINDGAIHRVRIGPYQDQDEANSIQDRMKLRYTQNANVQKSLVVFNK